jgi:hypothetical protein
MYLMIQNPGIAPSEGYTVLGVSTTRDAGVDGTVGQFGSGSKHAVNVLLRNRIPPKVYCGPLCLEFYTRTATVDDGLVSKNYGKVYCQFSGRDAITGNTNNQNKDLGFAVEYGTYDWTNVAMALREFVSNAIDRTIREKRDFVTAIKDGLLAVEVVSDNQVRAKSGFTRVFVPLTPAVQQFLDELPRRFLHFSEPENLKKKILPKRDRNLNGGRSAMIYKKGVLVREVAEEGFPSIYDYNFGDELELDESRCVNDYAVKSAAARALGYCCDADILGLVLQRLTHDPILYWEAGFSKYYLSPNNIYNPDIQAKAKIAWKEAWDKYGGGAVLCHDSDFEKEALLKKGYRPAPIKAHEWFSAVESIPEINSVFKILSKDELEGKQIVPATQDVLEVVDEIWSRIDSVGMTNGKQKPESLCFISIMDTGQVIGGYYCPGGNKIYINMTHANGKSRALKAIVLEEISHFLTGASDLSRDFQDYLINLNIALNF